MSNPNTESTFSKYKIWLIPILAATLLGVIIYNNTSSIRGTNKCPLSDASCPDQIVAAPSAPSPTPHANAVATNSFPTATSATLGKELPRFDLAMVLNNNPFHEKIPFNPPEAISENKGHDNSTPEMVVESEANLSLEPRDAPQAEEELFEQTPPLQPPSLNVKGIFRNGQRVSALVEDRIVYPGDIIVEGWRLVAIDSSGLVLEPIPR